ncbi:hypothetical protein K439DRAFT_1624854 [Ramaria rubella]|nr:hypothetical protein K439DRAFT_1624854 [Ramaria rubella]
MRKRGGEEMYEMRRMREEEQREEETQVKVFNFEKEKPQVLGSIVTANTRVQECLVAAKTIRKQVVCYIQLVGDEELIALGMYDKYLIPDTTNMGIESQLSHTTLTVENASLLELNKLQEKQSTGNTGVHPDLHDLDFNTLSSDAAGLLPPPWPSSPDSPLYNQGTGQGTLSDYSDCDSWDEETNRCHLAGSSLTLQVVGKGKAHRALSVIQR